MQGFFDVHSHVIPSGDDGVQTVEEGLALCRDAVRRGTRVLYGTPHVWPLTGLDEARARVVRTAFARMAAAAAAFGLELRLGWELTPHPGLLDEDLTRYALGRTSPRAVLIEFPFHGPTDIVYAAAELAEEQGLLPVLAHPERADAVQEDPNLLAAFAARDWILQVNASSMLGRHGTEAQEVAWRLVTDGAAGLVASDGHGASRPPFLDEAYAAVRARVGRRAADALFRGAPLRAGARLSRSRPPRSRAARRAG